MALSLLLTTAALAHVPDGYEKLPVNPLLGVPGFPDCVKSNEPNVAPEFALNCSQKPKDTAAQITIGCIGDSITAGVHSSGGNHTYPGQLQIMLDEASPGKYKVTNLGACGSTMLKISNSPYWKRPQYKALTAAKWDIIIIMLGTNDAKDPGDHGPNNWLHNCGGPDNTKIEGCTFAEDCEKAPLAFQTLLAPPSLASYCSYRRVTRTQSPSTFRASMIAPVRRYASSCGVEPALGHADAAMIKVASGQGNPKIHVAIPPPLMAQYSIGANQTVINSVYPKLVPLIGKANGITAAPIDVFTGMGGVADWATAFPKSCSIADSATYKPCAWWCDKQSCDQCHPNNNGYTKMASIMKAGLGL
jgi:lysophospholipase L1-like esterase